MEEDLVWKRKFSPITYSFKPIVGLVDELTIASYTRGEVTAPKVRILSPGSVWLLHSHSRSRLTYSTDSCKSCMCLLDLWFNKYWRWKKVGKKILIAEWSAESLYNSVCSKTWKSKPTKTWVCLCYQLSYSGTSKSRSNWRAAEDPQTLVTR